MPERTSYDPGTPSWVDLGTPDVEASVTFYGPLFGWDHEDAGAHDEAMGYGFFRKNGKHVAGVGPLQDPQQPPAWTSYVTVEDVDATSELVGPAGGQVIMSPTDLPSDSGRMAIYADSVGSVICGYQPKSHIGAQLVNEPGALSWNEHASRDPEKAQGFYGQVFGWHFHPMENPRAEYWLFHPPSSENFVGGMIRIDDSWPEGVPSHWAVYFAVEDADATAAKAKDLGGQHHMETFDTPAGRVAIITDPHGAAFNVIALNPDFGG
jgi:uncharacterized protein